MKHRNGEHDHGHGLMHQGQRERRLREQCQNAQRGLECDGAAEEHSEQVK